MPTLTVGHDAVRYSVHSRAGRITYLMTISAPGVLEPVPLRIVMDTRRRPWRPRVFAQAPECLRHRYRDRSLCTWFEPDPNSMRWVMSDGLPALVHLAQVHLYKEARCRAGEPWLGEESRGAHPRKPACRTCGGEGP
jgi:hypothetical protein